jgi:hypothetical protein
MRHLPDDLSTIEWASLRHIISGSQCISIPNQLLNLLSNDANLRDNARDFLFGSGQHTGMIWDSTPIILSFVIPLLSKPDTPDKSLLLNKLRAVAEHSLRTYGTPAIRRARQNLEVYALLTDGLALYLDLLSSNFDSVRKSSAELLGCLPESGDQVLPILARRFNVEGDSEVKIVLLKAIGALVGAMDFHDFEGLQKQYQAFLEGQFQHPDPDIRAAAAFARIDAAYHHDAPPAAWDVLFEAFIRETGQEVPDEDFEARHKRWRVIYAFSKNRQFDRLLALLSYPLRPDDAHDIVHKLLGLLFGGGHSTSSYDATNTRGTFYRRGTAWRQHDKTVFMAIAACDGFWQIPTNLLSEMYGLSDSRSALRALAENSIELE